MTINGIHIEIGRRGCAGSTHPCMELIHTKNKKHIAYAAPGRKPVHDTRRCNPVKEYFIHIERNKEPRQKNHMGNGLVWHTQKTRHSTNTDKTYKRRPVDASTMRKKINENKVSWGPKD